MNKQISMLLFCLGSLTSGYAQDLRAPEQIVTASCAACHGMGGSQPAAADYPRLAGQHKEYLEKSINDYIAGRRKDPVMREQVMDASTGKPRFSEQEIKSIAEYFSKQPGVFVK